MPAAGYGDLPKLAVLTWGDAGAYLTSPVEGPEVTCVVSIGDVGDELPSGYHRVPHRLRLEFADVEHEWAGDLATADDIRKLIAFAGTIRTAGGTTVVHCRAAIGRSPAAAYILFAVLLGPGREADALDAVLELRPFAQPNRWMVQLADAELGRNGRLLGVLLERPRR
ncbi:MAG TPA: hypothetical protein VKE22_11135 [Haliangiales bacterium]|nr:hypothetical protein [Haliangiales bacterium]